MIKLKDLLKKSVIEQVSTTSTAAGASPEGYKSDKTTELEKTAKSANTSYEKHTKSEPNKYEWNIKGSKKVWLAIIGPDTPSTGEIENSDPVYSTQIAMTIARLLDVDYKNKKEVGTEIKSVFK